VAKLVLYPKYY